jgi:Lipase
MKLWKLLTFKNLSIIHTDVFGRGILSPSGHVDFFVNGGFNQPGCHRQLQMSPGSCNHERAAELYAESIYTELGFWGFRCGKIQIDIFNNKFN